MTMTVRKPLEDLADEEGLGLFRIPFVRTVDDVASADECARLIERIEAMKPEVATITRANGQFELNTRYRNNDRVIFDDVDLARTIYTRLVDAGAIPAMW